MLILHQDATYSFKVSLHGDNIILRYSLWVQFPCYQVLVVQGHLRKKVWVFLQISALTTLICDGYLFAIRAMKSVRAFASFE